jgi:hypothetical protein
MVAHEWWAFGSNKWTIEVVYLVGRLAT